MRMCDLVNVENFNTTTNPYEKLINYTQRDFVLLRIYITIQFHFECLKLNLYRMKVYAIRMTLIFQALTVYKYFNRLLKPM